MRKLTRIVQLGVELNVRSYKIMVKTTFSMGLPWTGSKESPDRKEAMLPIVSEQRNMSRFDSQSQELQLMNVN